MIKKLLPKGRVKLLFISVVLLAALLLSYDFFVSNVYVRYLKVVNLNVFVSTTNKSNEDRSIGAKTIGLNGLEVRRSLSTAKSVAYVKSTPCKAYDETKRQFRVTLDGVTYPNVVPLYHNSSIDFQCLNSSKSVKTILMWTKFNGSPLVNYGFGVRRPFEQMECPVTNCELTNDRNKLNVSDLVLFHLRNDIDYFPVRHKANQRFVHVIYESPINCHLCAQYEGVFNLSANYREDSDFSSLYWTDSNLYWSPNDDDSNNNNKDIYATKKDATKFAAILASNCHSNNRREEFVKELKRYIPVDVYGKCGPLKCPTSTTNCREYIANEYKFYLSFENSLCKAYITEKFFDTLKYPIVPVVYGLGNYSFYAPKSAYVNVLDFKSPKDLADYLIYLDSNPHEYNSYFKWKKYVKMDERKSIGSGYLCEMCIKLHLEENLGIVERKQMRDMKKSHGLFENCLDVSFFDAKYFNISNLTKPIYSYFMSPER